MREARQRLAHFEAVVEQLRGTVKNLERGAEDDQAESARASRQLAAQRALDRAEGALETLAEQDHPAVRFLREAAEAFAPVLDDLQETQRRGHR